MYTSFHIWKHTKLKNDRLLKEKCHTGGGRVRKVPKKCHVLFEWPLKTMTALSPHLWRIFSNCSYNTAVNLFSKSRFSSIQKFRIQIFDEGKMPKLIILEKSNLCLKLCRHQTKDFFHVHFLYLLHNTILKFVAWREWLSINMSNWIVKNEIKMKMGLLRCYRSFQVQNFKAKKDRNKFVTIVLHRI
jgi:hypothetical protein